MYNSYSLEIDLELTKRWDHHQGLIKELTINQQPPIICKTIDLIEVEKEVYLASVTPKNPAIKPFCLLLDVPQNKAYLNPYHSNNPPH